MAVLMHRTEPIGAGVPYHLYLGLIWATEALALIFLALRLYSRLRNQKRIFWDDAFAIFAFILTFITAVLWQWQAPIMYKILAIDAGTMTATADIYSEQILWLKVSLVVEVFFYTTLTATKLSFLFFFRRLGENVRGFAWYWWPVTVFVLATWITCIGNVQYQCLLGSIQQLDYGYCQSEDGSKFTSITLKVNCALDVFSDFLSKQTKDFYNPSCSPLEQALESIANRRLQISVILIPVGLLWNIQMRFRKKMALIGLFSLSLITMAIATARAADLAATMWVNGTHDPTYLWLWSAIESCIAITVSCLSAFPQLFTSSNRSKKPVYKPTDTYYQRLASRMKSKTTKNSAEPDPYSLSAVSVSLPKHTYDGRTSDPNLDTSDSLRLVPVYVPNRLEPRTVCYKSEGTQNIASGGQITQERQFQVTRQWA